MTVAYSGVTAIKNGTATVNPSNYTNADGVITLKKAYLATQSVGEKVFTFMTADGNNPTCTITIYETGDAIATPSTAEFDKSADLQSDVQIAITNSGLVSVLNDTYELIEDEDYTVVNGVVTVKKEYLATLSVGTVVLTFITEDTVNPTCTITVQETA